MIHTNIRSYLFLFAIVVAGSVMSVPAQSASQFQGKKLERACLYGTFAAGTYTDCASGKTVKVMASKILNVRIPLAPDGKSFNVSDANVIKTRSYDDGVGSKIDVSFSGINGQYQLAYFSVSLQNFVMARNDDLRKEWTMTRFDAAGGGWEFAAAGNDAQITYPIAELGNCPNKAACKTYCEETDHILACVAYGERHGLVSADEAARAREFSDVLKGNGPGACTSKETCRAYCEDVAHIDECVSFGELHNLIPASDLQEAKNIAKLLKVGKAMPGGCKNKAACQQYCASADHAEECLVFAEAAGVLNPAEAAEARKVMPFLKNGQTPGGCKTKDTCKTYCESDAHTEECIAFAEKAGLMTSEEAALVKKTGGKGPGGCRSKEACETYCNDPKNADACFAFAKEHDLIPPEKLKEMQEGMGRLKAGLAQMPPEVLQCLKERLGDTVIADIEAGSFTPGPAAGKEIKGCFEQFLPKVREKMENALKNAPPEAIACLKNALGDKRSSIEAGDAPDPKMGEAMQRCFKDVQQAGIKKIQENIKGLAPEAKKCLEEKLGVERWGDVESNKVEFGPEIGEAMKECGTIAANAAKAQMESKLSQLPPPVQACVKTKLGADFENRLAEGQVTQSQVMAVVQACVAQMQPQMPPAGFHGGVPPSGGTMPGGVPPAEWNGQMPPGGAIPTEGYGGGPVISNIPPPGPTGGPVAEQTPPAGQGPDCSAFIAAPSCDYVPLDVRPLCQQCKGQ